MTDPAPLKNSDAVLIRKHLGPLVRGVAEIQSTNRTLSTGMHHWFTTLWNLARNAARSGMETRTRPLFQRRGAARPQRLCDRRNRSPEATSPKGTIR